jgi:hypothetical protein
MTCRIKQINRLNSVSRKSGENKYFRKGCVWIALKLKQIEAYEK